MKAIIIGMRNDLLKLSAVLILLAALAACAPAEVAPSATPIPSETPAPAASATNTPTLSPTASATRTPRPTGTLTPSPSPTPLAAFDQAKPIQLASGVGGWNLTFVVPNLNKAVNVIAAGIQFNCAYDERYPERLFCYGLSRPPLDQTITLAFLDTESGRVLYQSQTVFASAAFPTAVPVGNPETNCPQRGQNVTCETECRVDPSTNIPCIVSTCYDACGHYFSVDSCPGGVSVWNVCSDAQWQELKTRFNIP